MHLVPCGALLDRRLWERYFRATTCPIDPGLTATVGWRYPYVGATAG